MDAWTRAESGVATAFESVFPRRCDVAWLARVSGVPPYTWDVGAMQRGLFDLVYAAADSAHDRSGGALAYRLLEAAGRDPASHAAELAAIELHNVAALLMQCVRNTPDATSAVSSDAAAPLAVVATAAYTARQLAPVVVGSYAPALSRFAAAWLCASHGSALTSAGIARAARDGFVATDGAGRVRRLHAAAELMFAIPVDLATATAIAALDMIGTREGAELVATARPIGVVHFALLELAFAGAAALDLEDFGESLDVVRGARTTAGDALAAYSGPFEDVLSDYLHEVVDGALASISERYHEQPV